MMKSVFTILLLLVFHTAFGQENKLPIIDMHLHAYETVPAGIPASWAGEIQAQALISSENATSHLQEVLSQMEKHKIVLVLTNSTSLKAIKTWKQTALKELMDAGFGKRIMFGTDQMMWPGAIELAIKSIQNTPFLTDEEKRDIFYNNAARFLELDEETIAWHHE